MLRHVPDKENLLWDTALRNGPAGQLSRRNPPLGAAAGGMPECAVQHRGPSLTNGPSSTPPSEGEHQTDGDMSAGLRGGPRQNNPVPTITG